VPGSPRAVVVGQLARDVVLLVDRLPEPGSAADVRMRRETIGGKGANQAVALAQLGVQVALVAVTGDDRAADAMLDQAHRDGIDVAHVFRRPGVSTGLVVEVLDADGQWRYLQDLPPEVQLTVPDVDAAADTLRAADAVVVQLQQPPSVARAAARLARDGGALVVLDGFPADDVREELLIVTDVLRGDDQESAMLLGTAPGDVDALRAAGRDLVAHGPGMLVLGAGGAGNLVVWRREDGMVGDELIPFGSGKVVDTTGAGDALVAGLVATLLRGYDPPTAARVGVRAAGSSVRHQGGRPHLTPDLLDDSAEDDSVRTPQ
jgi:ribokinase